MSTVASPTSDFIWLSWEDKLNLTPGPHPIVVSAVTHKTEARNDDKASVELLLKRHRSALDNLLPGYKWTIEPYDSQPALKYVIRGDRAE